MHLGIVYLLGRKKKIVSKGSRSRRMEGQGLVVDKSDLTATPLRPDLEVGLQSTDCKSENSANNNHCCQQLEVPLLDS